MKEKSVAKPIGNQIRKVGQYLVKTWSAFLIKGEQKVSRNGADLEDFQADQGAQKVDKNRTEKLHQHFTETSPDFGGHSLEWCRNSAGKMSVVFDPSFVLLPRIAQYTRKSPIQFDIPSSYLYVVVLRKVCL